MGNDDVPLLDELTYLERLPGVDSFTGNAYGRFIDSAAFLVEQRTREQFGDAFGMLDHVLVFDEADQWRFSYFLSFGDGCVEPAEVLHGVHLCVLCRRHGGDVADVWGVDRRDPDDAGGLHPA